MGLLTKEVEVKLHGKNIKYYEDLGYTIPRIKDKYGKIVVPKQSTITIDTKDMNKNSHYKVDCECDLCKKIYKLEYRRYYDHNHDGKIYCVHCANTVLNSGENNHNYNANKTDEEREKGRNNSQNKEFIQRVLKRDNYICRCCGEHADVVHHLFAFSKFKELRYEDENGLSLCSNCHDSFHSWHVNKFGIKNKGKCTREDFEEWYGNIIENIESYNGKLPTARQVYCFDEDKIYESTSAFANSKNISESLVRKTLNKKMHLRKIQEKIIWYDLYLNMTPDELKQYIDWCNEPVNHATTVGMKAPNRKKVICLTTMEIFDCIKDAKEKYGSKNIYACCVGKNYYSGKLPDGTPLRWMYYDEYIEQNKENINSIDDFINQYIVLTN